MTVGCEAVLCHKGEKWILIQILPDGKKDTQEIDPDLISSLHEMSCNFQWNESARLSKTIGETLFTLLNSNQTLVNALKEADACGELLHLFVQNDIDLPFELLYSSTFLVPKKIHLIRRISHYGHKKPFTPSARALKILFMACSPVDVSPVLDFEKEEESIFEITKNLPVDMDVEDTGSVQGLKECLEYEKYDIIHLTGHADIDGVGPFLCMEDEQGYKTRVRPSELWKILNTGTALPRVIFLSGCRTGQNLQAAFSFAHYLVAEHGPPVVGWGLPVVDPAAQKAAETLYHELGRGKSIADAVFSARHLLFEEKWPDWSLLRLFTDGTSLTLPLVEEGQKKTVKPREMVYTYLRESEVKVLQKGFVGRRRQIQRGIKSLKGDESKVGVLLYGTGGLGKSCLAGKLCERAKGHTLVVVHGFVNTVTVLEALKDAFIRANDGEGLKILELPEELPEKIRRLCSSSFQKKNYLIVLDDFEKNLDNVEHGMPAVSAEAAPLLEALLHYLVYAGKMSQVIITSRYTFSLIREEDLVEKRLELIGLTSFQGADVRKKVSELEKIKDYPDTDVRQKLIEAGRGNPRLMDALNSLLEVEETLDVDLLLEKVQGKQEEFVQELLLREILKRQSVEVQTSLQYSSVYRLPVMREGIELVCNRIGNWDSVKLAVRLSLMEKDNRKGHNYYWVTPLLREELFAECGENEKKVCHKDAVEYYRRALSLSEEYEPDCGFELIDHALKCGMDEAAVEEGGRLLSYLRHILAYREALYEGGYILSHVEELKRNKTVSTFLFELGWILDDTGNPEKAIECYEKALSIGREVYGERHPAVATDLNNLGSAWDSLGDPKKAIEYYEKALSIGREVYGERHPAVATDLNNLGLAWDSLGDPKKAIEYYEKALSIGREVYGERHPAVATRLNNLGLAWDSLGYPKKAIEYIQQAYDIFLEFFGDEHPHTRTAKESLDYLKKSNKSL
jgi:tetratricopeptide (TPR) repeat protein